METIEKEILARFRENAVLHGEAIMNGERKAANKLHGKLMALYKEVNSKSSASIFKVFSHDGNESVALWSATFLLKTDTDLAIMALTELAQKSSPLAMTAKITLDLWSKGQLDLL